MKLAHPDYGFQIDFSEGAITALFFDNACNFRGFVSELISQYEGEDGNFILSADAKELNIHDNLALLLNPLVIDFEDKKITSKVNSMLKSFVVSEDMFLSTQSLMAAIERYAEEVIHNFQYPLRVETTDVASVLKTRGYSTSALHNNTGTFYSRQLVYPNLSFDKFIPIEFMYDVEVNSVGWAKDNVLLPEIQTCISSTPGRDFVFTVTVQTHGVYPTTPTDGPISVTGIENEEMANKYHYYINQIKETDKFIGDLVDIYSQFEEPTMIVFYGDHLPDLQLTNDDLSSGGLYQTEYIIWTNYDLATEEAPDIESYQLSAYILDLLGIDV